MDAVGRIRTNASGGGLAECRSDRTPADLTAPGDLAIFRPERHVSVIDPRSSGVTLAPSGTELLVVVRDFRSAMSIAIRVSPRTVGRPGQTQDVPSITALVEPELLAWARKTANYEPIAVARKIDVPDDRVEAWENGTIKPTITQLRKVAKLYRRPLGVFFLPAPPEGYETMRDFRRVYGSGAAIWSAELHAEYRRAHDQREALLEIAELDGIEPPTRWRSVAVAEDDRRIAKAARSALDAAAPHDYPAPRAGAYKHLNYWIAALEQSGVLVMHTAGGLVETEEMRAFSLYFERVPVIVLNGADWPRGRIFSVVHEYAHLLLHTGGLCDTTTDTHAVTEDRRLEGRCNAIAAEILMPAASVLSSELVASHAPGHSWTLPELIDAAKPFGVSVESFLRRLATLGRVSLDFYRSFRDGQSEQELQDNRPSSGNFYNNKARDLGKGYIRAVVDAHQRQVIDSSTAAGYLDVKVGQIPGLAKRARL